MQVEVIATTSDEPEQHSDSTSDEKPSPTCTPDDIAGYHKILVETKPKVFQVTYDSTADSHYWSYHPDATDGPAHTSGCRNIKLSIIIITAD